MEYMNKIPELNYKTNDNTLHKPTATNTLKDSGIDKFRPTPCKIYDINTLNRNTTLMLERA